MRHTTAESWVSVSELFAAMRPDADRTENARTTSVAQRELELRATLAGVVQAKRAAETANSKMSASLQRMLGDPTALQSNVETTAAMAHYNIRKTRAHYRRLCKSAPMFPSMSLTSNVFSERPSKPSAS